MTQANADIDDEICAEALRHGSHDTSRTLRPGVGAKRVSEGRCANPSWSSR